MSRLNGDKSRHQINRKRVLQQRTKTRKLVADAKAKAAGGGEPAAAKPAGDKA
jgi:hypothetical protein